MQSSHLLATRLFKEAVQDDQNQSVIAIECEKTSASYFLVFEEKFVKWQKTQENYKILQR